MEHIELLSPAGNFEKLETVFRYGADAAYLGGESFSLRAFAQNFSLEELKKAVNLANSLNKKIYLTLNIVANNKDIEGLKEYIKEVDKIGIHGVIVSDLGVFSVVQENSSLPIHISTQASNTNWKSVEMWHKLGATRVILAREVPIEEIAEMKQKVPDIEIEAFVHGAMCVSVSGRCLLSAVMTGRDANKGLCTHPCRWKYYLQEEKRPGEYYPVLEDERGTYILNSKDLCTIEFIDRLLEAGVTSLKIEGRIKSIYYAAMVTKVYKEAVDLWKTGNYRYNPEWLTMLESVSHRLFTSGFFLGQPDEKAQNHKFSKYIRHHNFVGKVIDVGEGNKALVEVRNTIYKSKPVSFISPTQPSQDLIFSVFRLYKSKEEIDIAHPGQVIEIETQIPLEKLDILRQKNEESEIIQA